MSEVSGVDPADALRALEEANGRLEHLLRNHEQLIQERDVLKGARDQLVTALGHARAELVPQLAAVRDLEAQVEADTARIAGLVGVTIEVKADRDRLREELVREAQTSTRYGELAARLERELLEAHTRIAELNVYVDSLVKVVARCDLARVVARDLFEALDGLTPGEPRAPC
jgi:chromosome segregation ATPase